MLRNIFPFTHLVVSLRVGYLKAVGTKLQADCQYFSTLQFCKALLANNIPVNHQFLGLLIFNLTVIDF